jgi:hypothetical protein
LHQEGQCLTLGHEAGRDALDGLDPGNGYPVTSGAVSNAPRGASDVDGSGVSKMGEATLAVASTELLERFYRDLLYELGVFAQRRTATAVGAAVVAKRVAVAYGIEAANRLPLPRLSRAEREEATDETWRLSQ